MAWTAPAGGLAMLTTDPKVKFPEVQLVVPQTGAVEVIDTQINSELLELMESIVVFLVKIGLAAGPLDAARAVAANVPRADNGDDFVFAASFKAVATVATDFAFETTTCASHPVAWNLNLNEDATCTVLTSNTLIDPQGMVTSDEHKLFFKVVVLGALPVPIKLTCAFG